MGEQAEYILARIERELVKDPFDWVDCVEWRTRDGYELLVGEMTDDHLLNAHRLWAEKLWYWLVEDFEIEPSVDKQDRTTYLKQGVATFKLLHINITRRGLKFKIPRVPVLPNLAKQELDFKRRLER